MEGRKKRQKWKGRKKHTDKIPNRVSIHDRPQVVNDREEFGHWEGDSVVYPNKRAINTMNDLTTGIVSFKLLGRKTALETSKAMIETLEEYGGHSLTLDNGSEFFKHELVSESTGVDVYFCDPYASYQRGSNENSNMLLRGYLPKRHNIDKLTQDELNDITWELNNRPRKRLGFQTPYEVYLAKFSNRNCCTSN